MAHLNLGGGGSSAKKVASIFGASPQIVENAVLPNKGHCVVSLARKVNLRRYDGYERALRGTRHVVIRFGNRTQRSAFFSGPQRQLSIRSVEVLPNSTRPTSLALGELRDQQFASVRGSTFFIPSVYALTGTHVLLAAIRTVHT